MQRVILCPKCRVQVKKDNLGELLCLKCGARLCPKAHIFDGRICPYCGWEDPNYQLWQKAQKARAQSSVPRKPQESLDSELKYVCPRCYAQVNIPRGVCPNQRGCGYSGHMQRRDVQESAARATQAPVSNLMDTISRSSKSVPLAPSKTSIATPRGSILSEIAKAERKEWKFPSLRRFVRPVLASLLIVIILVGLIMGGIYVTRLVSQIVEPGTLPPKTYTLSKSVIPEAGGDIRITSPSSSSEAFEPGTQVTLMAIPNGSYTFDYWEGVSNSSETMTITMDSDKKITAHFKFKDTTSPEISSIEVSNVTELCATVTWKTDDLTTGQVEYGKTDVYNLTTPSDEKLTANQRIRLTGLEPNTIYHFRIISQNASRLQAVSTDRTFKTVSPQPAKVGNRAPDFALPRLGDSSTIVLSDFLGKKVLLNLWATDCPGCVLELPYIQEIHVKHADLAVLTVCLDKNVESIASFAEEHPELTFPILVNQPSITKGGYSIRVIPTTFFIGSDGIIEEIKSGSFQNSGQIEEKLGSIDKPADSDFVHWSNMPQVRPNKLFSLSSD